MTQRSASLAALLFGAMLSGPALHASCGCGATGQPCVQETLETVAVPRHIVDVVPAPDGMEMTLSHCYGCGGTDIFAALVWALLLLPPLILLKRLLAGRDRLIVFRFDRLSGSAETLRDSDFRRARDAANGVRLGPCDVRRRASVWFSTASGSSGMSNVRMGIV